MVGLVAPERHKPVKVLDGESVRACETETEPAVPDDSSRPLPWQKRPGFGPFLRALRELAGMSLRQAASAVGLSFTVLQKMETGGRYRAPSLQLLRNFSHVYGLPMSVVLEAAGITLPSSQLDAREPAGGAETEPRETEAEIVLRELEAMSDNLPADLEPGIRLLLIGNASVSLMLFQDHLRANLSQVTHMRQLLDGSSRHASVVPQLPSQ